MIILQLTPQELKSMISEAVQEVVTQQPKQEQKPDDEYLTAQETADFLKISKVSLWKYTKSGKIKSEKFGRRILYKKSDLLHNLK